MTTATGAARKLDFRLSFALALVVVMSTEVLTLACTPPLQTLIGLNEIDAWSLARGVSVALVLLACFWIRKNLEIPFPRLREIFEVRIAWVAGAFLLGVMFFYGLELNHEFASEITRQFYQSEISEFREEVKNTSILPLIAVTLSDNLAVPVIEEFAFRGLIFLSLTRRTNYLVASTASSLLFAACHPSYFALMLCFGFCLCIMVHRSKSIFPAIVTHVAYNSLVTLSILIW